MEQLDREKLKELLKESMDLFPNKREFVVYTGEGGMDGIDVEMIIEGCDMKELQDQYRKVRQELFNKKMELRRLNSLWFVKLYKFIKKLWNRRK